MPISPPPLGHLEICLAPPPGPSTTLLPGVPITDPLRSFPSTCAQKLLFCPSHPLRDSPLLNAMLPKPLPMHPSHALPTRLRNRWVMTLRVGISISLVYAFSRSRLGDTNAYIVCRERSYRSLRVV